MKRNVPSTVSVREMTSLDLSAGLSLCRASGWNQTQRDWQMFLAAAPHGALVAEEAGRVIGTVATMPYGPFTWISMVLVDPSARGRGVGTLLLEHGVALVPDHVTARLDATESGEPLYRGLGFVAEYRIARWFVDAPARVTPASGVRPFERADWAAVHALDRRAFGVPRVSLLERLVDDAPEYAVALGEPGDGRAYLFGRHGHDREQLGPLIAGSPEAATALVETCLAHHVDRRFFIDVPQDQHAWTRVVSALGFVVERTFLRMHRGVMRAPGEPALVYAITGPEFG